MHLRKGFTLVELIVVIGIIGILATLGIGSYANIQKAARDAKRLSDMKDIQTALAQYYAQNGHYENVYTYGEGGPCGGWDSSYNDNNGNGIPFVDFLETSGLIEDVPTDSLDSTTKSNCGNYAYYRYNAGSYSCPTAKGNYYVLGIRNLENTTGPHKSSRGWSCPDRNWQTEFEWVVGVYE